MVQIWNEDSNRRVAVINHNWLCCMMSAELFKTPLWINHLSSYDRSPLTWCLEKRCLLIISGDFGIQILVAHTIFIDSDSIFTIFQLNAARWCVRGNSALVASRLAPGTHRHTFRTQNIIGHFYQESNCINHYDDKYKMKMINWQSWFDILITS